MQAILGEQRSSARTAFPAVAAVATMGFADSCIATTVVIDELSHIPETGESSIQSG